MKSNLKLLREKAGIRHCEMAKLLGVTQPTYTIFEQKGYFEGLKKAYAVAEVLGVSVYDVWPDDSEELRVKNIGKKLEKALNNAEKLIFDLNR